jgi:hypothetical protein
MVRERKTISLFTVGCPILGRFRLFMGMIEKLYGVNLSLPLVARVPEEERLSFLKQFCGGLLEDPMSHPWRRSIDRLGADARKSIAMSLFLFRKVLPSTEPDLIGYAERMSQPAGRPDPGFLSFVEKEVPKIFRPGWDRGLYENAALNATLPASACKQLPRSKGGARVYGINNRWDSHADYVEEVLTRESAFSIAASRVIAVETGGKFRIVSKSDIDANLFRPLHTAMYNHMSRFRWLLRGEAKPSSFRGFERVDGEVFTSGDYASATDNLNQELQLKLLDLVLSSSSSVPEGIKLSAYQMISGKLSVATSPSSFATYEQKRGQLMGNLLSFPLLCLVNYLGFRYYCGNYPVRVNGDDIVFRSPKEASDRWMKGVEGCGLTLSRGKTLVDQRYFSLNSSLFKADWKRIASVPMIRSTAFGFKPDSRSVESLHGRWKSFSVGYHGWRRSYLRTEFLLYNKKAIIASRRSLSRGLGISVGKPELVRSGLWARECFYLSLPDGVERPLPPSDALITQQRVPDGWSLQFVEKVTPEIKERSRAIGPAFVECAWSSARAGPPPDESGWRDEVRRSGYSWVKPQSQIRRSRLLGISSKNTGRYLRPKILRYVRCDDDITRMKEVPISEVQKKFKKRVWLPVSPTDRERGDPRPGNQLEEVGNDKEVRTFTIGRCKSIQGEDCRLIWGTSSVRIFKNGCFGYGPPASFPR